MQKQDFDWHFSDGLYIHRTSTQIDYHDGSEKYLTSIFKDHPFDDDVCPTELRRFIKDWPTRYHLSILRTNLLDAVEELFPRKSSVLELGAGTGALTTWLCKRFQTVDAVEGALDRAKVLKLRAGQFANLRVFVGDISRMDFPGKYDLITLVGVLEYIPYYDSGASSHDRSCIDFLSRLKDYLTDDGVLIVATENKLGAKYLSGFPEDHNGVYFSGLMDYPDRSPVTFSRNELEDILRSSGFQGIKFYHAFPDYKLPRTVIKEDPQIYEIDIAGFVQGLFEDFSDNRWYLFHDSLFLRTLAKARLIHHFSNSFLVLASKNSSTKLEVNWLARKFWNQENTRAVFHHTISLVKEGHRFLIERAPLRCGKTEEQSDGTKFKLSEVTEYVRGSSLLTDAYKSIFLNDDYIALTGLLKETLEHLEGRFFSGSIDCDGYHLITGGAVDCCLWNLIRTESGELVQIDNKWTCTDLIPSDFVIFRNLLYLFNDVCPFVNKKDSFQFILPIMERIFPRYTQDRLLASVKKETDFQNTIRIDPLDPSDLKVVSNKKWTLTLLSSLRETLEKEVHIMAFQSGKGWKLLNAYYEFRDMLYRKWRG
jgi:SAM-dependent methyltransferase